MVLAELILLGLFIYFVAVIVWRVVDSSKALFDVEDLRPLLRS